MDFISSLSADSCSIAGAAPEQGVVARVLPSPKVAYDTWQEFSALLMEAQANYCRCLVVSVTKELGARELPMREAARNFAFTLSHAQEQGPRVIMGLTKQEGPCWCAVVAHFVHARVLRASRIYQRTIEQLKDAELGAPAGGAQDELLFCRRLSAFLEVLHEEVQHTFSGVAPWSVHTLSSGFVSALIAENFTFYDDPERTAFTNSQIQDILLALCMGLHPSLGASSPLLPMHDELMLSLCNLVCASGWR